MANYCYGEKNYFTTMGVELVQRVDVKEIVAGSIWLGRWPEHGRVIVPVIIALRPGPRVGCVVL